MKHFVLLAFILSACSPENPKRQPPLEENPVVRLTPGAMEIVPDAKVDILFVIDDSNSMARHQKNLSESIKSFVREFEKNQLLDFHIGVTTVYDSKIKGEVERRSLRGTKADLELAARKIIVNPLGELIPLKNKDGEVMGGSRFVHRETPDYLPILEQTLLVGAKPGPDQKSDVLGPWFEELFTPVIGVLSEPQLSSVNSGFYRPDASLAIIFITDADDDSDTQNENSLYEFLKKLKGDIGKIQPYAAILPSGKTSCQRDNKAEPKKIEAFLGKFKNPKRRVLDICPGNFGAKLAQFAGDIAQSIPKKVVDFPRVPDRNFKIYYGDQLLSEGVHYRYQIRTDTWHQIVFENELPNIEYQKGATFRIDYVPVRPENQRNGRTKTI